MKTSYDCYGDLGGTGVSELVLSGRSKFHQEKVPDIVRDVLTKLPPSQQARLLEIGCNIGLLLKRLAPSFGACVGIDHPSLLDKFQQTGKPDNVELTPGRWPGAPVSGSFDRILVYSVLHGLRDLNEATVFFEAAIDALAPGGWLLIGDLPNSNKMDRYLGSERGSAISKAYAEARRKDREADSQGEYEKQEQLLCGADTSPFVSDEMILDFLRLARRKGCDSYVAPQPADLPFAESREDILVHKRA